MHGDDRTPTLPPLTVSLRRDADDYRAMHVVVDLAEGEDRTTLESRGWQPRKPIDHVLSVAGFTSSGGAAGTFAQVEPHVPLVTLRSFSVTDPARKKVVRAMVNRALAGDLGGFHAVAHGQTGFHMAIWAFEYAWQAAGCPPVRVHHPQIVDGSSATDDAPAESALTAEQNVTLAAVRMLEGFLPGMRR
jgi:hypothetical protein